MACEIRNCEICGSQFTAERWYKKATCSPKCKAAKREKTNIEKYGSVEEYNRQARVKRESTNLEKYGVKCNLTTQATQDAIRTTNLEKYGHKHASQNKLVTEMRKKTCIKKYGVDSFSGIFIGPCLFVRCYFSFPGAILFL